MNRRGFLTAMAAAPVAAFVAPAAAKSMAPAFPYEPVFGSSLSCGSRAVDYGQSMYVGGASVFSRELVGIHRDWRTTSLREYWQHSRDARG